MRRIAAHFVWYQDVVYRMAYVERDEQGLFRGVFSLKEEIAGTEFYDGVLIPVPASFCAKSFSSLAEHWREVTGQVALGEPVAIYHLSGMSLSAAKLGADDSGGNGHIERF